MDKEFFWDYIVPGSVIFPVLVYIIRYRQMPRFATWIFVYLVVSQMLNIIAIILGNNGITNLWLFHLETLVSTVLLMQFFGLIIRNRSVRMITIISLVAFPLFCIVNILFFEKWNQFNSNTRTAESFLLLPLSVFYWWRANDEDSDQSWGSIATNWIVTGIIFYFAGTFILFLLSNFILVGMSTESKFKIFDIAFNTNAAFLLIAYILYGIGFLKCKK